MLQLNCAYTAPVYPQMGNCAAHLICCTVTIKNFHWLVLDFVLFNCPISFCFIPEDNEGLISKFPLQS